MAPRVALCAAHQANMIVRLILENHKGKVYRICSCTPTLTKGNTKIRITAGRKER